MKTSTWFTTAPPLMLFMFVVLLLQGCSTTAGIGRDISAGGDALSESAEANKGY